MIRPMNKAQPGRARGQLVSGRGLEPDKTNLGRVTPKLTWRRSCADQVKPRLSDSWLVRRHWRESGVKPPHFSK